MFGIMNARSVAAKIASLVETIRETDLNVGLVSETWLKNGKSTTDNIRDLEDSHKIGMIVENRVGKRGGGVGIVYDSHKLSLKKEKRAPPNHEFVAASGKMVGIKRKLYVLSYYFPPNQKAAITKSMMEEIEDRIGRAKREMDNPYIIVGGDANNKIKDGWLADYPDVTDCKIPPTHGNGALLAAASNIRDIRTTVCPPLISRDGISSDHSTAVCRATIKKLDHFVKTKITVRPITKKGMESLKTKLLFQDWNVIMTADPDTATQTFTEILKAAVDESLPTKTRTIKSTDKPWITREYQRMGRRRKRRFKMRGRARGWKKLKRECDEKLRHDKMDFLNKVKGEASSGNFFRTIKSLRNEHAPEHWNIKQMFTGESEEQIAEKSASYFNRISAEYEPIPPPMKGHNPMRIERYEVAAALKSCRKPRSTVPGDLPPKALTHEICDILSEPLHYIYQLILDEFHWPKIWKCELVTLIPKKPNPSELSELRNLSCTPRFSKILESFILKDSVVYPQGAQKTHPSIAPSIRRAQGHEHRPFPD